jgi:hypothetical protein
VQLPVEGFHYPFERAGLRHTVAKMPDGVLVGGAVTQRKAQKPHPTQSIPDHIFHPGIGQIMLGLQDQDLEHGDRIERRTTTLAAIAITQPVGQPDPEILKIHRPFQHLKRIAMAAQQLKVIVQAEKRLGVHRRSSPLATHSMNHECPKSARIFAGVQLLLHRPVPSARHPANDLNPITHAITVSGAGTPR